MKKILAFALASAVIGALCMLPARGSSTATSPQEVDPAAMKEMMEKAARFTTPAENHELLKRFLGTWETETSMFMGGQQTPPEKGTSTTKWMMDGRWIESRGSGSFMGMPGDNFMVMGYDNFKQSYVATMVSSLDTAMLRAEGDMDPGGKALILYGTLDEYLTGEHDKMVKYVWRFVSDDEIVMEVHDLPIGEKHTKVLEIRSKRKK